MKIALDWIATYLDPPPRAQDAQALAEALMNAGLPVESIEEAQGVDGPTAVLDVEVTSNRTDCLCHLGIAREIAVLRGCALKPPPETLSESGPEADSFTCVDIADLEGCPYYSARIIRDVRVGPSPDWLARRLEAIGLRPVNNIVDITNFVLMELGHPLHAFDYDRLAENRILVRRARRGEKLLAIDAREYALDESMLVIADARDAVAIAGVMGGKATEVTQATVNVLLESARFEPLTIRTTSRALALRSDASYRFERGIDPAAADRASRRAAQMMVELCGGQLAPGVVAAGEIPLQERRVSLRLDRLRRVLGIEVPAQRAADILGALGFHRVTRQGAGAAETVSAGVPSHRLDVQREIDLVEEVARIHGYQHVPTLDHVTHPVAPEPPRDRALRAVRAAMVEAGFCEAVTVTFVAQADAAPFLPQAAAGRGAALLHPQHGGWQSDVLRPSLLPSLLAARRTNQYAGLPDAHLFETAATFVQYGDPRNSPPTETRSLAAVAGDVRTLTALLPLLAARLNPAAALHVEPQPEAIFVPGASGVIILQGGPGQPAQGRRIGRVGRFLPELQKRYDLRHAAAGLELELEALLAVFEPVRRARPVPRFPGVTRDLSIVVDEALRWAQVEQAIRAANLAFLEKVEFVTTFRSAQVGAGKKSLTLTLDFRDPASTLTSEQVDAQVAAVVSLLGGRFGAVLRA